jgi:signal transduction histidine kinase
MSVMVLLLAAVVLERQESVRRLQLATTHLEHRVAQRTRALTTSIDTLKSEMASRQKMQQRLIENERNLVLAQTLAHLGSWHWDLATNRFTCSEELVRIFGMPRGVPHHGYDELIASVHPEDRAFFEETLHRAKHSKERFGLEYRIVGADGSVRWLHGLGEVLADTGTLAMHGTVRDITENKVAEIDKRKLEFELLELTYRERSKLGYHLQNDLGQLLAGIAFLSKHIEQGLAARQEPETYRVGEIRSLVKLAIEKTRSVARVLVSANAEGETLQEAIIRLADRTRRLFAISCEYHESPDGIPATDALTTAHLVRIVQEAISNAVRHGKATEINVRMWQEEAHHLLLAVEDNGSGFETEATDTVGLGLPIMRHHAQLLGGELRIESTPAGTRVLCQAGLGTHSV